MSVTCRVPVGAGPPTACRPHRPFFPEIYYRGRQRRPTRVSSRREKARLSPVPNPRSSRCPIPRLLHGNPNPIPRLVLQLVARLAPPPSSVLPSPPLSRSRRRTSLSRRRRRSAAAVGAAYRRQVWSLSASHLTSSISQVAADMAKMEVDHGTFGDSGDHSELCTLF